MDIVPHTKYQNLTHPDLHLVFPVLLIKNNKRPTSDDFVPRLEE